MHLCGVCCTDEGRLSFCVCAYLFPWDTTPTTWVVLVVVHSEAYMTLEKELLGFVLFFLDSQSETMTQFFYQDNIKNYVPAYNPVPSW